MNRKEFKDELKMTYGELQSYLIQKYGGAKCDYFVNPECKSKNKSQQQVIIFLKRGLQNNTYMLS